MPLIVGLGNPGPKYEKTRHNIGFIMLDALKSDFGLRWSRDKQANAQIAEMNYQGSKIVLAKPMTFMNNSGMAVQALASKYKFKPEDIWVVYDDATIPFGKLRIRVDGSDGGHNGLKSIVKQMNSQQVVRFRLGVNEPPENIPLEKWVLARFSKEEWESVTEQTHSLIQQIKNGLSNGIESVTSDL